MTFSTNCIESSSRPWQWGTSYSFWIDGVPYRRASVSLLSRIRHPEREISHFVIIGETLYGNTVMRKAYTPEREPVIIAKAAAPQSNHITEEPPMLPAKEVSLIKTPRHKSIKLSFPRIEVTGIRSEIWPMVDYQEILDSDKSKSQKPYAIIAKRGAIKKYEILCDVGKGRITYLDSWIYFPILLLSKKKISCLMKKQTNNAYIKYIYCFLFLPGNTICCQIGFS